MEVKLIIFYCSFIYMMRYNVHGLHQREVAENYFTLKNIFILLKKLYITNSFTTVEPSLGTFISVGIATSFSTISGSSSETSTFS